MIEMIFLLTGAQQAACGRLGGRRRRQALAAGCSSRGRGQERGEVEAGAFPNRAEDRRRRVGGHGEGVVGKADGGPQVALVGRDAGVDGRGDEKTWLGRRDEKGLRPGASFGLFAIVVFLPLSPSILVGKRFYRSQVSQGSGGICSPRVGFYTLNQKYPTETEQGTPTLDCMVHNVQYGRAKTF